MSHAPSTRSFKANAASAMANTQLIGNLKAVRQNFIDKRRKAVDNLPEFDALRDYAVEVKNHTLQHLDVYLETFEEKVKAAGGFVHYAVDAEAARQIVLDLCEKAGAKTVTKGKSMITEEVGLNAALSAAGIEPIETDLGEYILQLRGEIPSHIIAPAVHLNRHQVEADFRRVHQHLPQDRQLEDARSLLSEAREVLRDRFLKADVGITGANFLVAETGSTLIVTNEGNGDLTQILPKMHIVMASIDKVVPTLEDVSQFVRLLARSATGQEISVYTTFSTGPKREEDADGPQAFHVILLDNGRSSMLGSPFQPMLRCIRCAACMNHCPVYHQIGGHAYGWVYPGPMGSVLTPALIGVDEAGALPNASTFCGRCEQVCPMRIPLPQMMRAWRVGEFARRLNPASARYGLGLWAFIAKRPRLYGVLTQMAMKMLSLFGRHAGRFSWLPGLGEWCRGRDFPCPEGETFQNLWKKRGGKR